MRRRVAIYARVSTEHEAQIAALENQVQYYSEILNRHPEYELYDRYIDEGITGTSVTKRPSFMRMMADAEKGLFDLIITREVSRFARNTVDTLQETRRLKSMGVEVWFTEDNIRTMNDSDGELRLTIMASLAQQESQKTSIRVKAGQMVSFMNGVPYGNGNILGYDKLPNHGEYVINKEQAETVRLIYDMYLKGIGLRAIQFELEKQGRKTATGKTHWDCAVISRVLKNPFYYGMVEYRKQFVPDYLEQKKINNHGEVEKIRVKGKHEPIVTEEEFLAVQDRLGKKSQNTKNGKTGLKSHADVWGSKLICECGRKFNRTTYHTPKGESKRYAYMCSGQARTGSVGQRLKKGLPVDGICRAQFVQGWKLEAQAARIFSNFFKETEKVLDYAYVMFDAKQMVIGKKDTKEKELDALMAEIEKAKAYNDKLLQLRLDNEITRDDYATKRAVYDDKISEATKKIEEIHRYQQIEDNIEERVRMMKEIIESGIDYDFNHIPENVIEHFVDKIVVHENSMEWHMVFDKDNVSYLQVDGSSRKYEVNYVDDNSISRVQGRLLLTTSNC